MAPVCECWLPGGAVSAEKCSGEVHCSLCWCFGCVSFLRPRRAFFGRRGWQLLIAAAQSIVVVCACAWASAGGLAGRGVEADHTLARFARHVGVAAGGGLVFPTQLVSFTSVERPARGRRASSHFWCTGEDRAELSVASAAIAQSNDGGAHSLCAWCCQGCFLSLIVLAGGLTRHRRAKPAFTICSRYLT